MITTVILDIGQVLAHFRWRECLVEFGYDKEIQEKVGRATVLSKYWNEVDRGALTEEEIIKRCTALEPEVAKEIEYLFANSTKLVREYPYSEEFIKTLKANGYKVYLLSNYGEKNFNYARENFKFISQADGMLISYEIKHIKPEPEIYETLLNRYSINPAEAVFLDDSAANLEGAKVFGIHTILVTEFDKAVEELRELGVNI